MLLFSELLRAPFGRSCIGRCDMIFSIIFLLLGFFAAGFVVHKFAG